MKKILLLSVGLLITIIVKGYVSMDYRIAGLESYDKDYWVIYVNIRDTDLTPSTKTERMTLAPGHSYPYEYTSNSITYTCMVYAPQSQPPSSSYLNNDSGNSYGSHPENNYVNSPPTTFKSFEEGNLFSYCYLIFYSSGAQPIEITYTSSYSGRTHTIMHNLVAGTNRLQCPIALEGGGGIYYLGSYKLISANKTYSFNFTTLYY